MSQSTIQQVQKNPGYALAYEIANTHRAAAQQVFKSNGIKQPVSAISVLMVAQNPNIARQLYNTITNNTNKFTGGIGDAIGGASTAVSNAAGAASATGQGFENFMRVLGSAEKLLPAIAGVIGSVKKQNAQSPDFLGYDAAMPGSQLPPQKNNTKMWLIAGAVVVVVVVVTLLVTRKK